MLTDFATSLDALLAGVSFLTIFVDAVTVTHLLAMAVALGSVVANDLAMLRYTTRPVDWGVLDTLFGAHRLISRALIVLWVSGLLLIVLRTDLQADSVTPKLIAKLITVTLLTLTAVLMGRVALPLLARSMGHALLDIPFLRKIVLAACAGLSTGGWLAALLLGGTSFLREADLGPVLALTFAVQGAALVLTVIAAVAAHVWRRSTYRPDPVYFPGE